MLNGQLTSTFGLVLVLLAFATVNLCWTDYQRSLEEDVIRIGTATLDVNPNIFREQARLSIEVALIISAVALWFRSRRGLVISLAALLGVELVYAEWLRRTHYAIEQSEALTYSKIPHIAYLGRANWLDVWVWGACTVLLIRVIKDLVGIEGLSWRSGAPK